MLFPSLCFPFLAEEGKGCSLFWGVVIGAGADFTDGCIVRNEGMELRDRGWQDGELVR